MKRKRKVKKKFIIIFILIVITIPLITYNCYMKNNDNEKEVIKLSEEDKYFLNKNYSKNELKYINKLSDKNKEKLKNIDYIDIKNYYNIKNFDVNKYDEYEEYKSNNDISYEKVVTYVNIGLNNKFYENVNNALYIDTLNVLVNKYYYLSKDYVPKDLVVLFDSKNNSKMIKEAAIKFKELVEAASKDNITLESTTAYRSYSFQNTLYTNYVKEDGKEKADTYSARPGYSEHQTGLAVDLNDPNVKGARLDDKDYKWLLDNAYKYGYIIRYKEKYIPITGYMEEPWHIRYVGLDAAKIIHDNDITFEEYIDLYINEY